MLNRRQRPCTRVSSWPAAHVLALALAVAGASCDDELGDCDDKAARELVYSGTGLVATKGQALMHDTCGQGAFCHSSAATGDKRLGVPKGLDFDMFPYPTHVGKVIQKREQIWQQVVDGQMPPKGYTAGNGDWLFDARRRPGAPALAPLSTTEGKGAFRNWLACGAPTVADTRVPDWARPIEMADPQVSEWSDLHGELRETCVSSGCHDASNVEMPSVPGALTVPFVADECIVYRWLLFGRNHCGERLVVGGDPDASALLSKIADVRPTCGDPMPPPWAAAEKTAEAEEMADLNARVQQWVKRGALAPQCEEWSELAPRVNEPDGGAAAPSWQRLHGDLLAPRCATAGCHDAKMKAGDLDLSNACGGWQALQRDGVCGVRLVAGKPEQSSLYQKLTTEPGCGTSMPPGAPLRSSQVSMVRAWIEAGASGGDCE